MNNKLLKYFALPLVFFASACSTTKEDMSMDTFSKQLAHNYKNMSDSAGNKYKIKEKRLFRWKSSELRHGRHVGPIGVAEIELRSGDDRNSLLNAREFLLGALNNKSNDSIALADLQFYFDCWVDQETRMKHETSCKTKFWEESKKLKGHKGCAPKEKVHFQFDNYIKISHEEMKMIKEFAAESKHNNETILVIGHADKTGGEHYNKTLSLKRARRVADVLVSHGISKDRIKLMGVGDKYANSNDAASRNASLFYENEETMECFKKHHNMTNHSCGTKTHHHKKHHKMKKGGCNHSAAKAKKVEVKTTETTTTTTTASK